MTRNTLRQKSVIRGFTLIELVVTITILGILAVTALPKYLNMKSETVISTMQGLKGSLDSAAALAHAKAVIDGVENKKSSTIDYNGTTIEMTYGYPAGKDSGIALIVSIPIPEESWDKTSEDWNQRASTVYNSDSAGWGYVYWHGMIEENAGANKCYIRYRSPTSANSVPEIDFESDDC
ncbi:MSHA biogenesis protein MshA [Vibrio sp. HA2012]|uniref:type II secretion system protein n=1 Tax=Vibrio sp. HA2012 TaxID=1971595 RepID=UPI000C2CE1D6|nr:type II secretion system protein [Vibrio sp. HA2012]PJC87297.1 MSHA biogenesis protein MshA [Vibrio sp. HA2012]